MPSSFSYKKFFGGDTLMVIVPHADDEINIAGATICGAREEGMRVLCVFATNGDRKYIGDVRIHEAIRAVSVLGVPKEDIIFLGYPDGGVSAEHSVYLRTEENSHEVGRNGMTYGSAEKPEFCMSESGSHHTCTWQNFLTDMQSIIEKYLPDAIIAIDFDRHPDHRMCSIAFETVMGRILNRKANAYHPNILKAFAYTTAFESVIDLLEEPNLFSTVINEKTRLYTDLLDNPCYKWENRVRLPVPASCRTKELKKNKVFRALLCHISQRAMRRAPRIINSDEVFWRRHTDNLIYQGHITVSSGNCSALHDFRMIGASDIVSAHMHFNEALWIPAADDASPHCRCDFDEPHTIREIILHGNVTPQSYIHQGRIIFSTGYALDVGSFPKMGQPLRLTFPVQKNVSWIEFHLTDAEPGHAGLSEWEIFERPHEEEILKLCINGHFAYNWLFSKDQTPKIAAYNPSGRNISYKLNGKPITETTLQKTISHLTSPALLRAEADDGSALWDEITLTPMTGAIKLQNRFIETRNKCDFWIRKQAEKLPRRKLRKYLQK